MFVPGGQKIVITPPWGGDLALGSTEDGFHLYIEQLGEAIKIDDLGQITADGINAGLSLQWEIIGMEYDEDVLRCFVPQIGPPPNYNIGIGDVGALWTEEAFKFTLTPTRRPGLKRTFWLNRSCEPAELLWSTTKPKKIPFRCEMMPDMSKPKGQEFCKGEPLR